MDEGWILSLLALYHELRYVEIFGICGCRRSRIAAYPLKARGSARLEAHRLLARRHLVGPPEGSHLCAVEPEVCLGAPWSGMHGGDIYHRWLRLIALSD